MSQASLSQKVQREGRARVRIKTRRELASSFPHFLSREFCIRNRELEPFTQGCTAGWNPTSCWWKAEISVLMGFKKPLPAPSGERERAREEMRGCPHPCPREGCSIRGIRVSAPASQGAGEGGTPGPTAFQGEIKICPCGRQALQQCCQKAGCGFHGLQVSQGTRWLT